MKGSISLEEISKKFGIDKALTEEWAKILEEHNLVELHYPILGTPFLTLAKPKEEIIL